MRVPYTTEKLRTACVQPVQVLYPDRLEVQDEDKESTLSCFK